MMSEVKLGEIELLQIHGDLVKRPERFDPAPLVHVDEASVDSSGILGWTGEAWIVDVHHQAWPGRGARRPVSIGFSSHYDSMRDRFRDVALGAAGENIIISAGEVMTEDSLGERLIVRGADGLEVELLRPKVAKPCLQFTSYMLDLPEVGSYEEIGMDQAFLDGGMRGFIVAVDHLTEPVRLRLGDEVFLG